jgi:hypothetical protein
MSFSRAMTWAFASSTVILPSCASWAYSLMTLNAVALTF